MAKILLSLSLLIFPFGQLTRLNYQQISFPLFDLTIGLFSLTNFYLARKNKTKPQNLPLAAFILFAWLSFIINLFVYPFHSLKPLLYLIRLSIYLSFFIFPIPQKVLTPNINRLFHLSVISTLIFGLIQYFFWPNLTYFASLDWDPHLYRLTGSFLDPTFTGLILLLFLTITLSHKQFFLSVLTYIALALTYSRSSLLALLVASLFFSLKIKKIKFFLLTVLLISLTLFILPRYPGEGTKLNRTASITAKIKNYQQAIAIFSLKPIIGHGYNNLPLVRADISPTSHANFGFDSSLLTILATTGVTGFYLFCLGLKKIIDQSSPLGKILFVTVLTHSLFSNSLLYSWILFFLAFKYQKLSQSS